MFLPGSKQRHLNTSCVIASELNRRKKVWIDSMLCRTVQTNINNAMYLFSLFLLRIQVNKSCVFSYLQIIICRIIRNQAHDNISSLSFHPDPDRQLLMSGNYDTARNFSFKKSGYKRALWIIHEAEPIREVPFHPSGQYALIGTKRNASS